MTAFTFVCTISRASLRSFVNPLIVYMYSMLVGAAVAKTTLRLKNAVPQLGNERDCVKFGKNRHKSMNSLSK